MESKIDRKMLHILDQNVERNMLYSFIHLLYTLVTEIRVTGVSWNL